MMKLKILLLDDTAIDRLKRHLALRLPGMRLRTDEFAARALGYRTYASLLSALREDPVSIDHVEPECAAEFAERVGYEVAPDDLCVALTGLLDLDCRTHASAT